MANQRDIKRRIDSVANTQKITRAMKLVAAAKFAKASYAVTASRPYSESFNSMVLGLVASSDGEISSSLVRSATDEVAQNKKSLLIVLSTDRGLCGGLNSNLFKFVQAWESEQGKDFDVYSWGRKASSWASKRSFNILDRKEKLFDKPKYSEAKTLVDDVVKVYNSGEYASVYLAYNKFVNALTQTPTVTPILPLSMEDLGDSPTDSKTNYIVEPGFEKMIDTLIMRRLYMLLFQAILEGCASEHGSRMTAMDSATSNADEVRKKLKLQYNRARQAAITTELTEIISGAEAL